MHEQRVSRRDPVKLLEREPAGRIGELARRPATLHHDPLAGRHVPRFGGQDLEGLAPRTHTLEPGLQVPALDGARQVEVVVDEARDDRRSGDVDNPGRGTRVSGNRFVGSAGDDTAAGDGQCVDDAEVRVDGQDLAARDDGVGSLLRESSRQRAGHEDTEAEQARGLRAHLSLSRDQQISGCVEAKQICDLEAGGVEQLAILAFGTFSSARLVGQQHEKVLHVRERRAREVFVQHRLADQERPAGRQRRGAVAQDPVADFVAPVMQDVAEEDHVGAGRIRTCDQIGGNRCEAIGQARWRRCSPVRRHTRVPGR